MAQSTFPARIRSRHGALRVTFLAAAITLVLAWRFPEKVLAPAARFLVAEDVPEKSDAIVILLGADTPERVLRALELFAANYAPRIVHGSGFVDQELMRGAPQGFFWPPPSIRERLALQSLHVPDNQLVVVDTSSAFDTQGELEAIAGHARREQWKKLLLVTSATHSRRASIIWHRVAPDITVRSVPAREPHLDTWWKDPRLVRALGYECGALVKEAFRQLGVRLRMS